MIVTRKERRWVARMVITGGIAEIRKVTSPDYWGWREYPDATRIYIVKHTRGHELTRGWRGRYKAQEAAVKAMVKDDKTVVFSSTMRFPKEAEQSERLYARPRRRR